MANLEKRVSLREAGRITGIDRHTLRRWLENDLGLAFPRVKRGSKVLVRVQDVEAAVGVRTPSLAALPRWKRRVISLCEWLIEKMEPQT